MLVCLRKSFRAASCVLFLIYITHIFRANIHNLWPTVKLPWLKIRTIVLKYDLITRATTDSLRNRTTMSSSIFTSPLTSDEKYFMKYWVKQERWRYDYKYILSPCENQTQWKSYYLERTVDTITSARSSYLSTFDIRAAGQYSRFVIQSVSYSGKKKSQGGDSWRVHVRGASAVQVSINDHNDGSYEVFFLVLEPGYYEAYVYLDYSLCDGFKEPPLHWFKMGNAQGKYQPPDALPGHEKPYLEDKFQSIFFQVVNSGVSVFDALQQKLLMTVKKCVVWDGLGRWVGNKKPAWVPYFKRNATSLPKISHKNGTGVFWIYGDSVGDFLYRSLLQRQSFNTLFASINRTYCWVYNLKENNLTRAKLEKDSNDFSSDRVVSELQRVLDDPRFDNNSVILLNYGLHFAQDVRFSQFKEVINKIVDLLLRYKRLKNFRAKIIWKTTTALYKEKYGSPESKARHSKGVRFLTVPRVELFNSYSTAQMCRAGIDIIDVHALTETYPFGTGSKKKPWDAVHFESQVFDSMLQFMEGYFGFT